VVSKLVETYIAQRTAEERFIDTVRRIGIAPFKRSVYGEAKEVAHA
jgi:sulfite reductase (NADPH) hemoprotein beta-component